jgi:hypothetical protein
MDEIHPALLSVERSVGVLGCYRCCPGITGSINKHYSALLAQLADKEDTCKFKPVKLRVDILEVKIAVETCRRMRESSAKCRTQFILEKLSEAIEIEASGEWSEESIQEWDQIFQNKFRVAIMCVWPRPGQ